jgi:UDP-N-acetyl-2-amino-2-deoxyglucuronate dehydrogenase
MKKIKCGIIGCGVIAPSHIESYINLDNVEVTRVCDLISEKASAIAERYNIPQIDTDYHVMLNDPEIDCVSVCTDHGSHAEIVIEALNRGKHVICEKSLGISLQCLESMVAAHQKHPELAFGGIFQHRFEKTNRYIKSLIDDGSFGTLTNINLNVTTLRTDSYYNTDQWRGTWAEEGGSLLINQAIHFIDLVNWFSGGVSELYASCENMTHQETIETEDSAAIILKFRNGMLGTVTATSSSVEPWRQVVSISGTHGYVEILNNEVIYHRFAPSELHDEVARKLQECKEEKTIESNKDYYGEGHPAQIKDFISAIRENRQPFVAAASASSTVEIVLGCYKSSKTGKWVKLNKTV